MNQEDGLPQGSVLSLILFNTYTNDQPLHDETRNFIYADDLCVTSYYPFLHQGRTYHKQPPEEVDQT